MSLTEVSEKLVDMRTRRMELETAVNDLDEEYRRSREGIDGLQKLATELQPMRQPLHAAKKLRVHWQQRSGMLETLAWRKFNAQVTQMSERTGTKSPNSFDGPSSDGRATQTRI